MTFKLEIPDIPLFTPSEASKTVIRNITRTLNDILSVEQVKIRAEAPIGATADLRNNILTELKDFSGRVYTGTTVQSYAVVVHEGRSPGKTPPPYRALIPWLRRSAKGQRLFSAIKSKNKRITLRGAAIMLSKSIGKKGTIANPFFQRGIDQAEPIVNAIIDGFLDKMVRDLL